MFEGSMLERVARSYHAVQEKAADEHGAMSKYFAAVSQIENLKKEAEGGVGNGITFHLDPNSNLKVLMSSLFCLFQPSLIYHIIDIIFSLFESLSGSFRGSLHEPLFCYF